MKNTYRVGLTSRKRFQQLKCGIVRVEMKDYKQSNLPGDSRQTAREKY